MTESSAAIPTWRISALVGRVGAPEILVEDGVGGARLPTVDTPIAIDPFAADALRAVTELLGTPLLPLRLTWLPDDAWQTGWIVVEAEPLVDAPSPFRWRDPAGVLDVLEPSVARPVVDRWLQRRAVVSVPHEPPWARPGWFARAATWMVEGMAAAGFAPTEAPSLVYQGPLAAVLRARSDDRAIFLKCTAPAFAHEAAITHALARRTPEGVPEVIASDARENWVLMHDHGGRLVGDAPPDVWVDALRAAAALQRGWVGATATIVAAGGQTRPLAALAASVPGMLDQGGLGARLTEEIRASWIAAVPRLVDACGALDDLDVPATLIHGDLHPGNVVLDGSRFRVVDWSDAAVGHPFVDLATFVLQTKDPDLRRRLRDAYADAWDGVLPRPRLDDALELAMTVGALYQVATYQALLPAMEAPDRALLDGADASWVRRTLEALDQGLEAGRAEAPARSESAD